MGLLDISSIYFDKNIPDDYKKTIITHKKSIYELKRKLDQVETEKDEIIKTYKQQEKVNLDLNKKLSLNIKSGLPNRLKLAGDLPELLNITGYQDSGRHVGILIIQLDKNYSALTKTLKSSLVDWVLYKIASKIKKIAQNNNLYHTHENEFILILNNAGSIDTIIEYAKEISGAIKATENISGYHITIGSYIGISVFPEHGIAKDQLLTAADIAVEYARERKLDYLLFRNEYKQAAVEKLELQNYIIKALEMNTMNGMDEQFMMYFQPVIQAGDGKDGKIRIEDISAEALIRWHHPEKGMISPDKFIPLSEETGIIVLLGNWIMYRVADTIAKWKQQHKISVSVSINVSSLQFHEGNLVDFISRIIKSRNIDPSLIRLELTETSLMADPVEALYKMVQLKETGIKLCIDDFGTGYSSFNYLRQFSIDVLKIDKSFVESVFHSTCDQAIIRAIVAMSKELGFDIVVEGVEDLNQFNFLYKEGCRKYQGYLFSKAIPENRFIEFYRNNINKNIIT